MYTREAVLDQFALLTSPIGGIGQWIHPGMSNLALQRIREVREHPITHSELNQLLLLCLEGSMTDGCFTYYWLTCPEQHPYPIERLPITQPDIDASPRRVIHDLDHLYWGLYRLFVDGLLYFGNVRTAYRQLRTMSLDELQEFYSTKQVNTRRLRERGPILKLYSIAREDRHLISEIVTEKLLPSDDVEAGLWKLLVEAWDRDHDHPGAGRSIRELLIIREPDEKQRKYLEFSASSFLDERITRVEDINDLRLRIQDKVKRIHSAGRMNANFFLSMVSDLDAYVATSMRSTEDFLKVADTCKELFSDVELQRLGVRYFDPTMSVAQGHEDKGLIECLMVKCARMLILIAGEGDSYGKDAEAAMALSLGKPVVFLCDDAQRATIYQKIHPLTRLIDFSTGVAVGAMVTSSREHARTLLYRHLTNRMEYRIEKHPERSGFLRLHEQLTNSVVRLQTDNPILTQTFWDHYKNRPME